MNSKAAKLLKQFQNSGQLTTINHEGKVIAPEQATPDHLDILGPIPLPTLWDQHDYPMHWYPFKRHESAATTALSATNQEPVNSILATPGFHSLTTPLIRVHSCCFTGDVLHSQRCECGPQLEKAVTMIHDHGGGAVIYMAGHEGRGIGLWAKAFTYLLQDQGLDTYQANIELGLAEDSRDFADGAAVLKYLLKGKSIALLSNNPEKQHQLSQYGQKVERIVAFEAGRSEYNKDYLAAKKSKGHLI